VDDHQVELAQQLVGHELIEVVYELEDIEPAVKKCWKEAKKLIRERCLPRKRL
jgi:UDP-N-acetylglucosamine transferase subunit ALG13